MLSRRDDIQYELNRVDDRLAEKDLHLHLALVGGAALIMNGMDAYETEDMDSITHIINVIRMVLDDLSVDINDDALDYIENYEDREFITEQEMNFTNISIEYLSIQDAIITKNAEY